jgi:hypothetical protein
MDTVMQHAAVIGIAALCAALGIARATLYRRKRRVAEEAVLSTGELGGRSSVAVCGQGTVAIGTTNRQEVQVQTWGPDGGNPTPRRQGREPGAPGQCAPREEGGAGVAMEKPKRARSWKRRIQPRWILRRCPPPSWRGRRGPARACLVEVVGA